MTLNGAAEPHYLDRLGWYYRPSQDMFEFWWQGSGPMIALAAVMLDVMPTFIQMEILASVTVKPELTD